MFFHDSFCSYRKDAGGNVIKKTSFDDTVVCMMVGKEMVGADEKDKSIECITNTEFTRPGYLGLNPKGATRKAKSAPALSREKTKTMLESAVSSRGTTSRSYLKKQNKMQEESEVAEDNEPLTPRTVSISSSSKVRRKKLPETTDYALALKHAGWPEAASEWPERCRNFGWPGQRIEKKIVSTGCHVTPGAHPKSEDPDIEWEYTFFESERILDKEAVSSVQRQCFILFCLLCSDCLESKSLTVRQLKTVFYDVCETTDPQIWRSNKAICVNKLVDTLLESIRCGNLRDYFIPKNNTISHLEREQLVKLEASVAEIRKHPTQVLLDMTSTCAIVNIFPFYCNVRELFNPFIADADRFAGQKEVDKTVRAMVTVIDELCNSFYLDTGFQFYEESYEEIAVYISSLIAHGVSGFEECIEYFIKPLQGDSQANEHLDFLPQLLSQKNISLSEKLPPTEIWRPIRMCRLLIQKFSDAKQGSHLFDHLGCMYHSASKVFEDHRKTTLQKAENAFKEALGKGDCGIGTFVDYGRFLCKTKRFDDSLPLLRKVIMKESKKPESINFYGKMESLVADPFIKREIEATDGLEVISCTYAYYLMCECYFSMKKKADLLKSLNQFEDFCKEINDVHSYSLLGYTFMKLRQFKKALVHFTKVKDMQPDNKLVYANIASCTKFDKQNVSDESLNLEKKMEKLNLWK